MPSVGNFDSYKDFYNRQDMTSFGILSELHCQEIFEGNFSATFEDLREFLFIIFTWKANSFDNVKLQLGTLWIKNGVSSQSRKHNVLNPRQVKQKDNFIWQYWFFINLPSSSLEPLNTGVLKLCVGTTPNYTHIYVTPQLCRSANFFLDGLFNDAVNF